MQVGFAEVRILLIIGHKQVGRIWMKSIMT